MTSKWLLLAIALMACALAHAETSGRKVVDPKYVPYGHIAGALTIPDKPRLFGNAFLVGTDGCHIISSYHVVFADGVDPVTKKIKLVKPRAAGYEVDFAFDLDGSSGKFRRRAKAVVVELGGFDLDTTEGFTQDMVLLRLKPCAGKEFAGPELDHPEPLEFVPTGKLTTISSYRNDDGSNEIRAEVGCVSATTTPVAGTFFSNCHAEPGMSGSMILEKSIDGRIRLVGITTAGKVNDDGSLFNWAVHSSSFTPFIESVLGVQPNTRPPKRTRSSSPPSAN